MCHITLQDSKQVYRIAVVLTAVVTVSKHAEISTEATVVINTITEFGS